MSKLAERVLIADADGDSRLIFRDFLEYRGRHVLEASNGEDCLRLAREDKPDVVVVELLLRDPNGWETVRRLRDQPETSSIPILGVTAAALEHEQERAIQSGCDHVVPKPLRPERLLLEIDALYARLNPAER